MKSAEIIGILSELPHVQAVPSPGHIKIAVPGFDDSVYLPLFRVQTAEKITLPEDGPGVGLGIRGGGSKLRPLIITSHAVGFAPAPAAGMLDSELNFGVSNAPDFVTYAEMERDAHTLARLTKADLAGRNLMGIVGAVLLVRCFIVGAIQVGLRPVRALSAWERAWAELGEYLPMPEFRPDEAWEELRAAVNGGSASCDAGTTVNKADLTGLTIADFEALAPYLTISRLDEEFLGLWQKWVPVHPARLAEVLLDGLDHAQAELALYPDGGGCIDLTVEADSECLGLLQLGFSFWDGEFSLDEVSTAGAGKGSGLFKNFMKNMVDVAALLGFEGIDAHFTGVGSYVGARMGFLPD